MSDILQRFIFSATPVRGEVAVLEQSWQEVLARHGYPPAIRARLGEMLVAALLLSATLKFKGSLTLQVQGDGPVNLMVVSATAARTVRGMAQWQGEVPEGHLAAQFGSGRLIITIDPGAGERYQGIVELEGDSLAAALEAYLWRSEQLSTHLWLAADDRRAAGLLLQKLPGEDSDIDADAWERVQILAGTITAEELLNLPAAQIMHRLFHQETVDTFDPEPVRFACSCSRERVAGALHGLGAAELEEILQAEGEIEAICEFCNQRYHFDAVDVAQLFVVSSVDEGTRLLH